MKESLAYADSHPDEVRAVLSTYTQITADARKTLILPKWPADIDTGLDRQARRPVGARTGC